MPNTVDGRSKSTTHRNSHDDESVLVVAYCRIPEPAERSRNSTSSKQPPLSFKSVLFQDVGYSISQSMDEVEQVITFLTIAIQ
jgi:hypothetical protein